MKSNTQTPPPSPSPTRFARNLRWNLAVADLFLLSAWACPRPQSIDDSLCVACPLATTLLSLRFQHAGVKVSGRC